MEHGIKLSNLTTYARPPPLLPPFSRVRRGGGEGEEGAQPTMYSSAELSTTTHPPSTWKNSVDPIPVLTYSHTVRYSHTC